MDAAAEAIGVHQALHVLGHVLRQPPGEHEVEGFTTEHGRGVVHLGLDEVDVSTDGVGEPAGLFERGR